MKEKKKKIPIQYLYKFSTVFSKGVDTPETSIIMFHLYTVVLYCRYSTVATIPYM